MVEAEQAAGNCGLDKKTEVKEVDLLLLLLLLLSLLLLLLLLEGGGQEADLTQTAGDQEGHPGRTENHVLQENLATQEA